MPFTHQITLSTEKGQLQVGEGDTKKAWTEPLTVPPVKNILLMNKFEEDILEAMNLTAGPVKSHEGSKFMSYAAAVGSVDGVKILYKKLKAEHQMATHIIGAYRVFGTDHQDLQSFCDDGEHGGGRRMLNILKELGLFNLAVFIIRYKDGNNIGKKRFEIIIELTKMVLMKLPHLDRGERRNEDDQALAEALCKAVTWKKPRTEGGAGT